MSKVKNVTTVNIVASGKFDVELDLAAVAEDLGEVNKWIDDVEHSRRCGNRLLIDFTNSEALGILAPSGVYVFTGVDTDKEIEDARRKLFNSLDKLGILSKSDPSDNEIVDEFSVQNVVCTADVEEDLNLNAVGISLGLENTEYEPEQFPGLIYRPEEVECTILLFATGKIVITGGRREETAEKAFEIVTREIDDLIK